MTDRGDTETASVELSLATAMPLATLRTRATQGRIAVARQFAAGAADAFGAGASACEDAKLGVTEACTNAVVHAYGDSAGPLQVEARRAGARLIVSVRDAGRGGAPEPRDLDEGRYGLALIEAVADAVQVESSAAAGTQVRMEFELEPEPVRLGAETSSPAPIVRRIVSLLAAEAGFSLDRLADAVLAAETVVIHAGRHASGALLGVSMRDSPSALELRVGPLAPGGAEQVLREAELPAVGSLVERLADDVSVQTAERAGEFLIVHLDARV